MGDIVELVQLAPTKDDSEFVTDLARFAEAIVSEADIKRKYRFGDEVWAKLGDDDELVRAIEAEKIRRIRDGSSKREKAQALIVKAPGILDGIMSDPTATHDTASTRSRCWMTSRPMDLDKARRRRTASRSPSTSAPTSN